MQKPEAYLKKKQKQKPPQENGFADADFHFLPGSNWEELWAGPELANQSKISQPCSEIVTHLSAESTHKKDREGKTPTKDTNNVN